MPTFSSNAPFNPNPISKILVVFITGLTVMHSINIRFELAIVYFFRGTVEDRHADEG